ncbi:TonB-dependent receptor domain-containing protein, partial [Spongiibacter tropicus]
NINVDREWDRWGVNASLRLVGSRYEDAANNDELSGYGLLDAGISYRLREDVSLKFAVKNALDKEYISARGGSLGDYQSVGREALLSITYNP